MAYWIDAWEFETHMYKLWMSKKKNRKKARYRRKLNRIRLRIAKEREGKA